MQSAPSKFYITTAIDYPNSAPHMGHAYEKIVADFYARAHRLRGTPTRFLIGLDEHGQKIQNAAQQAGKSPQVFVDEKAQVFRDLYALLDISHDDFIRTSEPRHRAFAAAMYERLRDAGDVYQGVYEGDYCVSCEKSYTKSELVGGKCPLHDTATTTIREESYFFRLGKYRDRVKAHIEAHPDFIYPAERRNEILSRLGEEVLDLSISRSTFDWGIRLPDDARHVLYVWVDALSNYISALKQPRDLYEECWPADCHVIGKDIIWFHTVIWPAMLLSAGLPLPRQVYAHGFILDQDGRKMSKHLGNVVDPLDVVKQYPVDVLRFYCLRVFSSGLDGRFSLDDLADRYEAELANDLGNLISRLGKLAVSRLGGKVKTPGRAPELDGAPVIAEYFEHLDAREHHRAVETLWGYIRRTNKYLNDGQPWKLPDGPDVERILGNVTEALRTIAHLASPMMPGTAATIGAALGFELGTIDRLLKAGESVYQVIQVPPLFPRREKPKAEAKPAPAAAEAQAPKDPFARLELRVGRIVEVREHPNADALWAMIVDLGAEKRSICAGLRQHLRADELQDRKVLVLANLKPAMLRGIESAGMVLATDRKDGKVAPVEVGAAEPGDLAAVEGIVTQPKAKISISDFEKAPLSIQRGQVTYAGKPLRTSQGAVLCDAEDGARVR